MYGPASTGAEAFPTEYLVLPPSRRLDDFVAASAARDLDAPTAVRLALERALAVTDAAAFSLDVETARRLLRASARQARAKRALTPAHAHYVRKLVGARPRPALDVGDGLHVAVPDRVLVRVRGTVSLTALRADVVPEMVAWEIAATLAGRTMGEWALRVLAAARGGSARVAA
jgi:hypothetical protein